MNRATATINVTALKHNLSQIKALAPKSLAWAMIKSNGYGHGLVRVAKALSDANAFGVACIDEALTLREVGIKSPIIVMKGFYNEAELSQFARHRLGAVIHCSDQVSLLEKTNLTSSLSVWLKIDTGMNRLGFSVEQSPAVYNQLKTSSSIQKPIGLMTHLADADNENKTFTELQIKRFFSVTEKMIGPKSIVNSAGFFAYPNALVDWIRPGIILYGISPFGINYNSFKEKIEKKFRPVMTLSAKIIAIKNRRQNDSVGYGCAWSCSEDMPIAIVSIGYGDGYPRHAPSGTPVLLNGKICPLIGRVSMDMIAIDLRSQPNAQVGDDVILWGEGLPVEIIAEKAGTIAYELLCKITQRVQFIEIEK
ncbi:alanine racemase [Coxiella burnetii]|uniref:alanine racemase n=1 Tax=Coxiella burnetii TaxID=777 RepID=UPI000CCC4700|nr:alanine racemase [Coxiella burnetii]PNT90113.1 alanine racemase [Coxiella burnetii]